VLFLTCRYPAAHRRSCLRKTAFLSHLYIKTNTLPRQARDKHRENSKKDAVFPTECLHQTIRLQQQRVRPTARNLCHLSRITQAAQRRHRPRPRDVTQLLQAELTGTIGPYINNQRQGRKEGCHAAHTHTYTHTRTHAESSFIMITMTRNLS
jgi:hypothetical protein